MPDFKGASCANKNFVVKIFFSRWGAVFSHISEIHSCQHKNLVIKGLGKLQNLFVCDTKVNFSITHVKEKFYPFKSRTNHTKENGPTTAPFVVVFHSAAARPDHGVQHIAQKHPVKDVIRSAIMITVVLWQNKPRRYSSNCANKFLYIQHPTQSWGSG
jgi:hypothetical protein